MIRFLCEETAKQGFSVNLTSIFTFIGMAFSIVVSLVALVWLTCFAVRLLIKTFKVQVQNSYDVYVENSTAKANSRKERNAKKRQAKDARKLEILNLKEESRDRVHQMKVNKLSGKLLEKEEKAQEKYNPKPVNEGKIVQQEIKEEAIDSKESEKIDSEMHETKKKGRPSKK